MFTRRCIRHLAMALFAAAVLTLPLGATRADEPQRVGVNAAVNTDASGTPPGGTARKLVIGEGVVHNERITTDNNGQTQILFIDGSSVSVGPNSDMTIDDFVYDPSTGTGKMTLTELQGAMRFVGGKLSKQDNAVTMHMGAATIGVRGGVFLANVRRGGGIEIIFVYGKAVTVTSDGRTVELFRPGFAVEIGANGVIGAPHQAPPGRAGAILTQLDGRAGGNGGATNVPTDTTIANSPIPNTISNNVQVSVQQASQNNTTSSTPVTTTATTAPSQVSTNQVQTSSSQSQPAVTNPTPPMPAQISGLAKVIQAGSNLGFTDQSSAGRIPYTGTLANGVATGSTNFGQVFTLSPLLAGQTTNVTGTANPGGTATGTAFLSPDGAFFYGNLVSNNGGGDRIFVIGGRPVSSVFFAAGGNPSLSAFQLQPDPSLGAQTVPFLAPGGGGTLANPVVSPLYVVNRPGQPFGSFNANANPNGAGTFTLQASLAINGTGTSQQAVLNVATGSFFTDSGTGKVVGFDAVRGMYMAGGTAGPIQTNSGAATVPDANGNTLFGTNSIDGFVLDSNSYDTNNNFITSNANFNGNSVSTNYAFNQVALASGVPTGVGTNRSALNEIGFFGGIMAGPTGRYALNGVNAVITDPMTNKVLSEFVGGDLLTGSNSGVNLVSMVFGDVTGRNFSRSTFIDNNIYGATESEDVPWTFNGNNLQTRSSVGGGSSTPIPTGAIVTSGTVSGAANGLFAAAGAAPCTCQYLQWGYWSANIPQTNSNGSVTRNDRSYINTWLSGTPTVTLPTSGMGTYNGAAIGTVFNAGNSYLAAGQYSGTFNFGNNTGTVAINNFDGRNFSGSVGISQSNGLNIFSGNLKGSNLSGGTFGAFYGPNAEETGGSFAVKNITGPSYIASGIFAGR